MKIRFKAILIWFGVCFCLLMMALPTLSGGSSQTRFLTFTVKNEDDIYLRDLKLEEIELRLDQEPVEVRYLGYKNVDTAFAFVLENSPRTAEFAVSMPQFGQLNTIDRIRYQMLEDFFLPLTSVGSALLSEFYRDFTVLQDFTSSTDLLVDSIHRMTPNFSGLDVDRIEVGRALGRAVDLLRYRTEKRKVLVLFTTSVDRESYGNLEEYQEMLRETDLEVYFVSFGPRFPSGPGYSFQEKMTPFFFRRLAGETSGRAYFSGEFAYLDELFTDLKSRLQNGYTIGFHVQGEPEPRPHEVSIRVRREDCNVTHKEVLIY